MHGATRAEQTSPVRVAVLRLAPAWPNARALDLQCFTKALFLTPNQSKFHLLTTPEVELLVSALKPDDAAYNLYVGMVTFQPGSCRWISELQSVEL